jgi:itaconyl-CoA hydratase
MPVKPGWEGRFYEDFEVGDIYIHPSGRTITSTDNSWFSLLTLNVNPMHFDHQYAAHTEFGHPIVNSCFTLALVTGMSVIDVSQNAMANLGWDEVRLPHPVFEGDTLYARSEVLDKRLSKSHSNIGLVRIKTIGFNQDGITVIEYKSTLMIYKRKYLPQTPRDQVAHELNDKRRAEIAREIEEQG